MQKRSPSRLQRDLIPQVSDFIRSQGLQPGDRITEQALSEHLQVSRTPVRAVLNELAQRGVLQSEPRRGFSVREIPEAAQPEELEHSAVDRICSLIAGDRQAEKLPADVSEADLMRRYSVTRPLLLRVLGRLSEIGMADRKPGHGWTFPPVFDEAARRESYQFRFLIEPAGIMEDTFFLDLGWAGDMRERHRAFLATPWTEASSIGLFEMNAAFHEGLAQASGNRFFLNAIRQQNRLRRFSNYDWRYGRERVTISCSEHLEILERLEKGEKEVAASLLRKHLQQAYALPSHSANE